MADNVTLNSGTGGPTLSTDEVTRATVVQHVQYVKLMNGTDGAIDVIPGDATNGLTVNLGTNNDVTITGTATVTGAAAENAAVSGNPVLTGGRYDVVSRTLNDGDVGGVAVDVNGHLITSPHAEAVALPDTVSNTVNIAYDHAGGFIANATFPYFFNGTTWDRARGDATNGLTVNLGANNDVTVTGSVAVTDGAGSLTVDGTVAISSLPASTNTIEVVGDVAHDVAVSGNPVRLAGRAVSADYTSVATGDTADLITTLGGKLVTHPYAIPENYVSGATSDITTTTSTSVVAAGGVGLRNYITHIVVQNSHATVGTWVNIQDGSGGTTIYTLYCAAAGGGASITLPCPIKTTANTALYAACATTGANVRVSASGYKAP